jgi:hypothetical protein
MNTFSTALDGPAVAGEALARDRSRELLGRAMGLVAVTVGFTALGAYLGRDLSGATGLVLFIGAFAVIFGLNSAAASGREQLAVALLFALGLLPLGRPRVAAHGVSRRHALRVIAAEITWRREARSGG